MKKQQYIRPELTVVAFRTERGYAASSAIDEAADRVNGQLENWALQTGQGQIGSVTEAGLWAQNQQAPQQVAGIGNETDGLQAGYFGTGSTLGWF